MPHTPVPLSELQSRIDRLREEMHRACPGWDMIILDNKIDLYYFTGTMPDGIFAVTPKEAALFVRRSYGCSRSESNFEDIRSMGSFREIAKSFADIPDTVHVAERTLTLQKLRMLGKYLPFTRTVPIDKTLMKLRSVKSGYELQCMRRAGRMHSEVIENAAPALLREGISEAGLCAEICAILLGKGAMGVSRFNSGAGEDVLGLASFGENSLRPAALDTPTGTAGTSIAMKSIGSSERRLHKDEVVLLDIPGGFRGYHTDKSITFFYGRLDRHPKGGLIRAAYEQCRALEEEAAKLLVPGAVPEEVFQKLCSSVAPEFKKGFMNTRAFVGHSIGLTMDETPVLAKGFAEPLEEGMTFAVEPKIAIEGVGLVGSENTYEVVGGGPAVSLTGSGGALFETGF